MKTPKLKPVTVKNSSRKKAKFNLSHDNNTTYDWGSVQPIFSKMMLPDSSMNIQLEQLTRLAPMVVPTFGRVKLKNVAHFIPMKEIFPNWEYFLSQKPISRPTTTGITTFIPTQVPHIASNILTAFALAGAKINCYVSGAVGGTYPNNELNWRCYRNDGTWGTVSPSAASTAIQAIRDIGSGLLGINNAQTPTYYTNTEAGYYGPVISLRKIITNTNGNPIFAAATNPLGNIPALTTMLENPIDNNANANGWTHSFSNEQNAYDSNIGDSHISMDGADLIWESDTITSTDRASGSGSPFEGLTTNFFDGCKIRLTFKLSSFGKRLRKILIGLGYNFSLVDSTEVSLLPLIAFYKAWWDTYAPERTKNFYQTSCWQLIQILEDDNTHCNMTSWMNTTNGASMRVVFREFMLKELSACFATEKIDAISAATEKMNNLTPNGDISLSEYNTIFEVLKDFQANYTSSGNPPTMYDFKFELDSSGTSGNQPRLGNSDVNSPYHPYITQPMLDALKKAYIFLNKNSVAGQKIAEILRINGQGAYVDECNGKFINANDETIKISDVVATAATSDAKLGQYGGRGLGIGSNQFSFSTNEHGYMIILSAIVPESGYINAPDMTNEAVTYASFYQPDFDGMNYEAVVKKQVVGSTLVNAQKDNTANDTFGFLPTYSNWKFCSNKANGDFSLNSMKNSLTPYTLDKYIPVNDVNITFKADTVGIPGTETCVICPTFKYSDLPNAGEDYRYVNKMPWNGNYNRIFNAQDDGIEWQTLNTTNNNAYLFNSFEYDNFLTHNVMDIAYWAPMKSIEDSYSTYDEGENENRSGATIA